MKKKQFFILGLAALFTAVSFFGCAPMVEYVETYVCPKDKKQYATPYEAATCCGEVIFLSGRTISNANKVLHMHQTINGESYVLVDTENKNVAKDTEMNSITKAYNGFAVIGMFQNGEAVTILYDRKIITYIWQTGSEGKFSDGTTEKSIKGLYGASVTAPIATSSTHNFGGWFTSDNLAPGTTFGEKNLTFTVKWTSKDARGFNWYETPMDADTGEVATADSTYVYFGVFPRNVLDTTTGVTVDETKRITMGANTYYKGNDGNYYAKAKEDRYGSNVLRYSDGTTVKPSSAESYRYFKVEPIKWKILTKDYNGKCLLLAEDILTANVPYYSCYNSEDLRTVGKDTEIYPNNYKYSQIRAYLNGLDYYYSDYRTPTVMKKEYTGKGFLQTAFTSSAQLLIVTTSVDNRPETTGYSTGTCTADFACANTEDKIFLLSVSEVINSGYGFASYNRGGDGNARIRFPTDYAKANYAYASSTDGDGGYWWLRSPYYSNSGYVRTVYVDGRADDYSYVRDSLDHADYGVVPALSISF
ncbi:MAG: DUF6273 domain-containing protein [Treponema sp.]|uniref:DUF6273 domain-containing protein n=1 Tax=Treponema sp. TaxID=166 RepID=UPI00298EADC7|nr:DUF6273 domain-containing protein [Treponema sp.]MCQ2600618.1 DUF6273 domain-containing protein [Treponema sp.]